MTKDFADLPGLVQVTANTHIALLERALPGRLKGYFIVGSAALGDFLPGKSDVDFVTVTAGALPPQDVTALARIHRVMHGKRMLAPLDGWYIPGDGMAGSTQALAQCVRFNGGKCAGAAPFCLNSPDGWVLRQYGVPAMDGGSPASFPIDWDALLQGMAQNLDSYWRKWARASRGFTPKALALLMSPVAAEWGVLGISRLYYTFRERDVVSKTDAGRYALDTLPARWHGIINRALEARHSQEQRVAPSARRKRETLAFVAFMMDECQRTR